MGMYFSKTCAWRDQAMGIIAVENVRKEIETVDYNTLELDHVHKFSHFGFKHSTQLYYTEKINVPPTPKKYQEWQVGYIQNVLWEQITAQYGDAKQPREYIFGSPILDKQPSKDSGIRSPWYFKSTLAETTFGDVFTPYLEFGYDREKEETYLGAVSIVDYPNRNYFNEFRGEYRGKKLKSLHDNIKFGLWVAAKPRDSGAFSLNSYYILLTTTVSIDITVTMVDGVSWPIPFSGQREGSIEWNCKVEFGNTNNHDVVVDKQPVKPVLDGPIANDVVSQSLANTGIVFSRPHMNP